MKNIHENPDSTEQEAVDKDRLYAHLVAVLSVSAGMVGVCLTAISLIGVMKSLNELDTVVDDLLVVSSLLFMVCSALSFLGMRTSLPRKWRGFTWTVDVSFFLGLMALVVACVMLTWVVL
jgi:hypothetical protein